MNSINAKPLSKISFNSTINHKGFVGKASKIRDWKTLSTTHRFAEPCQVRMWLADGIQINFIGGIHVWLSKDYFIDRKIAVLRPQKTTEQSNKCAQNNNSKYQKLIVLVFDRNKVVEMEGLCCPSGSGLCLSGPKIVDVYINQQPKHPGNSLFRKVFPEKTCFTMAD